MRERRRAKRQAQALNIEVQAKVHIPLITPTISTALTPNRALASAKCEMVPPDVLPEEVGVNVVVALARHDEAAALWALTPDGAAVLTVPFPLKLQD